MKTLVNVSKKMIKNYGLGLLLGAFSLSLLTVGSSTKAYSLPSYVVPISDSEVLELATGLEDTFWTAVVNHDSRKLSKLLADEFLGISLAGVITRDEELVLLNDSHLPSYTLTNVYATRKHDVVVLTYLFTNPDPVTSGLIDGYNISTWVKSDHHWKLVSHSFFPFLVN
jgi:hypothetical protein